jgi:hypothetical protein
MILESLIQNEMRVCLDCAKATLVKGSRITIPDDFYQHKDVQGAIAAGFAKLVGEPPAAYANKPKEKTKKLRNIYKSKIAFECIKGTVEPGMLIEIPESAMNFKEIQNALAWNMLADPEAPPVIADVAASKAATIEEVKLAAPGKQAQGKKSKKAKAINRVADAEEAEEKDEDIALYKESKVIDPSSAKNNKIFEAPPKKEEKKEEKKAGSPDRFDFLSIFGEEEK